MNIKCFIAEKYFIATGEPVPAGRYLQVGEETGWRNQATKELLSSPLPVGAMYRSWWLEEVPAFCGTDGQSWTVVTPGGEWHIDGRASNCTLPDDSTHKCWCRHGEAPAFTVNKQGRTCSAGAGSIQIGNYHGFLVNGELTDC